MATALMASEVEIKQAMGVLGLDGLTDALLDEIELDRELAISLAEADRGEKMPIEQAEKIMKERFANGYYNK
jgi:hypothetical protein